MVSKPLQRTSDARNLSKPNSLPGPVRLGEPASKLRDAGLTLGCRRSPLVTVMHRQPHGRFVRSCPFDPVPLVPRDADEVARLHFHDPVLEPYRSRATATVRPSSSSMLARGTVWRRASMDGRGGVDSL